MNLDIGSIVLHKKFGEGIILSQVKDFEREFLRIRFLKDKKSNLVRTIDKAFFETPSVQQ